VAEVAVVVVLDEEEVEEVEDNSLLQETRPKLKTASRQIAWPMVRSLLIFVILG
jgi:hypothetical protein